MRRLFTCSILFAAALLFMLQPLAGKVLLPVLGGSPAVWSTCLVFFQGVLLLGYLYAHVLSTRLPRAWQGLVHVSVLVAASAMLPAPTSVSDPGGADPRWWVLSVLAGTVGLPFFALSATGPLLQRWFSRTDDAAAGDPYFLYAASNAGSLLGLLAYPALEPFATRRVQMAGWAGGFWMFALLVAACAYVSARRPLRQPKRAARPEAAGIPLARSGLWILLALVPSALLLGVTQHLATDVISAPLLWIIPLAVYLVTLIGAFSSRGLGNARRWGAVSAVAALVVLTLSLAELRYPIAPIALAHLAAFGALAWLCHARLADSRPGPRHLTQYYLCISLGGALGAVAVALIAPIMFSSILEYPLAIALALLLRPQCVEADRLPASTGARWAWRAGAAMLSVAGYWSLSAFDAVAHTSALMSSAPLSWLQSFAGDSESAQHAIRAAFAIPAAALLLTRRTSLLFAGLAGGLLLGASVARTGGDVLHRERTFFGVHQVTSLQNGDFHALTHGTTTHGIQAVRGKLRALPTAYYHPSGPIGDVIFALSPDGRFRDVAVVGLGAGALAAYAGNGVRMDFFEVDDAVIRMAEDPAYFTYLTDARSRQGTAVRTRPVDGRVGLRGAPEASYDLIVIDAFSSDAIPTHLLTREAVAMYASRVRPRGVIAFHVSNRFFDLPPVLATIAGDLRLVCFARDDRDVTPATAGEAKRPSVWVVLARNEDDLGQIARSAPRWVPLAPRAGATPWSDDYANVLGALNR